MHYPITFNRGKGAIANWELEEPERISPTHRLTYLQKKIDKFWFIYRTELLPQLIGVGKWNQEEESLQVENIVLVMNENMFERSYCLIRVLEVCPGSKTAVCQFRVTVTSPTE